MTESYIFKMYYLQEKTQKKSYPPMARQLNLFSGVWD